MSLKCQCGGTFRRVKIERFDFTGAAGLPSELRGAPGLRCAKCGEEALDGAVIEAALVALTQQVLILPSVLAPQEAKFLRKRLQLSQKDLAERMGISRETVAAWECGQKPLSPQHDYILRGLHFGAQLPSGAQPMPMELVARALGKVHSPSERTTTPEPFIISEQLTRLRETAIRT